MKCSTDGNSVTRSLAGASTPALGVPFHRSIRVLIMILACLASAGIVAQQSSVPPKLPDGLEPADTGDPDEEPESPPLPAGLEDRRAGPPALPEGLGGAGQEDEPALPAGLGADERETARSGETEVDEGSSGGFLDTLTGFWDVRGGARVRDDPNQRATSMAETRLQLSRDSYLGDALVRVTADLVYDNVADGHGLQLERGRGWLDLREAYFGAPIGDSVDLRIGRQVLTWGVGDLLFLNDLFPKDWNSFLVGRDVEYLKAPSDAIRASLFLPAFNLDLVYTPKFDPDRFIDNRRLSFFDPRSGEIVGENVSFRPRRPDNWFSDDEIAFRLYRLLGGWELAAYGYLGYWKSPQGFDPVDGRPLFPELSTWGGSARGPVGPGIVSLETAWYRSGGDLDGSDPFLPNSQLRFLAGYEREVVPNFTLGGQYYLERTLDHDALVANQPSGLRPPDENRHLLTLRATLLTHSQNVTWSLFTFASPSDEDAYLRGSWSWKATDAWTWSAGFNLFEGTSTQTFFGQFETNSNVYFALRRGF